MRIVIYGARTGRKLRRIRLTIDLPVSLNSNVIRRLVINPIYRLEGRKRRTTSYRSVIEAIIELETRRVNFASSYQPVRIADGSGRLTRSKIDIYSENI